MARGIAARGRRTYGLPYPTIFLAEVRRVLAPGGVFVGSMPNAYRDRNRLDGLRGRPVDRDPVHVQFFSLASLRAGRIQ